MASATIANRGASTISPQAAATMSKARFSALCSRRQRRAGQAEPGRRAELDDARLLEAVEHGLGAEMDLGGRAQERVDAGLDLAGPRPRHRDVDVVWHAACAPRRRRARGRRRDRPGCRAARSSRRPPSGRRAASNRGASRANSSSKPTTTTRRGAISRRAGPSGRARRAPGGPRASPANRRHRGRRPRRANSRARAGREAERQRAEEGEVPGGKS